MRRRQARHVAPPPRDPARVVRSLIRALRSRHQQFEELLGRFDATVTFADQLASEKTDHVAAMWVRAAEIQEFHAGRARVMAQRWITQANIKNVTPGRP